MARNKRHNFKSFSSLKRNENSLETPKLFIVACEGEKTEPNYLNALFDYLKRDHKIAQGSFVIAGHQHSDPCGVLEDLLSAPEYSDLFDEKWIVIDRDEVMVTKKGSGGHTKENFCKATSTAKDLGVGVAWSNPCFELWFVLHFNYRNTACARKEMQDIALKLLIEKGILKSSSSIGDMKSTRDLFDSLLLYKETAIKNAKRLMQDKENEKPEDCNPGTRFHMLVEHLEKTIKKLK